MQIDKIVNDFLEKNGIDNKNKKTIMFPHEKINSILNNKIFNILYNYNIKSINRFSILYEYKQLSTILNEVKSLMRKIKRPVLAILEEYKIVLNACDVKESAVLINYFNIHYFYTLISKLLKLGYNLANSLEKLYTTVKEKFIISNDLIDDMRNNILYIFMIIKINLKDINTKLFDIY
jgi:hypothetical protein